MTNENNDNHQMTDKELFLSFYEKIGIELKEVKNKEGDSIIYRFGHHDSTSQEVNQSNKFDGYYCFYSDIEFTKEGKFVRQGFWE